MKIRFPKHINSTNKILLFDTDEFSVGFSLIVVPTLVFKNPLLIIIGLGLTGLYIHVKKMAPRSFSKHLPYYLGLKEFKHFKHSFVEKFYE